MKVFILKIKNFWVRISCLLIVLKKPVTAALSFYHFSDKLLHVQLRSTGGSYSLHTWRSSVTTSFSPKSCVPELG